MGVAYLRVSDLGQALLEEGIYELDRFGKRIPIDLISIAKDFAARDVVERHLYDMMERQRSNLFVLVTEKKAVTRNVAVPIAFFLENLSFVWEQRQIFIGNFAGSRPAWRDPGALIPSMKTGGCLRPNSVGNLLKTAFNSSDIKGSGHRLRASFAEELMRDAYYRARAAHGRNWDPQTILFLVAEALGHRDLDSLTHYLNQVIREDQLVEGNPVFVADRKQWLNVRALVDHLNSGNRDASIELTSLLARLGIEPEPDIDSLEGVRERLARHR
jgi:hypothetical protein